MLRKLPDTYYLMNHTNRDLISSFGRRKGRKLSTYKDDLMKARFARYEIALEQCNAATTLSDFFSDPDRPLWLEIGFGDGDHLAQMARANPEINYIGCEPYIPGVGHLVHRIEEYGLDNIKIFPDDVRLLLKSVKISSIDKIFILFPDPWRKKRHYKRRIISNDTLSLLATFMPAGSELQLATDHTDYAEWMIHHTYHHPCFEWTAKSKSDWENPPPNWVPTKYEMLARSRGNDTIVFLNFIRNHSETPDETVRQKTQESD